MDYGENVLRVGELRTTYLLAALAIGIGLGSFAAGYLSGGKIEYGLVPLGSLGITVFAAVLWHPALSFGQILAVVGALGFFGGFFIVPISAILQHRPAKEDKGVMLAAANLLSSAGLFVAAGVYWVLAVGLHFGPRGVFAIGALMTLAATVYVVWLLPDSLLRFVLWLLTHTVYRIRVDGRDNIPDKGGALFVCNHLSLVDAMLLLASTDRPVRFIMYKGIYEQPWVKPFARILRAIPISSELRPREMLHALRTASEAIQNGEVVCIFAEGQITRIGHLLPFRRGFERIMKDVEAPIIPVALDGVWGSIFSFEKGRFLWKLPRRIPYRVTVNFGEPLPHYGDAVRGAGARAGTDGGSVGAPQSAHETAASRVRADGPEASVPLGHGRRAIAQSELWLRADADGVSGAAAEEGVGGAADGGPAVAAVGAGGAGELRGAADGQGAGEPELHRVRGNAGFLHPPVRHQDGADLAGLPRQGEAQSPRPGYLFGGSGGQAGLRREALRVGSARGSCRRPGWSASLGREKRAALDDLATVIFSSGSTGEPKGVMLSHYNVGSNIEQLEQVFGLNRADGFVGVLPFFHSFGFTGTLCLPAVLGVRVVYHPNPLEAKAIGPLVSQHALTFLLATPTFLQLYMRGCAAEDFGSLRVVMTAAEKLPERLATAFEEQFGIRPLEGYGCTECAPVVAVNTHDFRSAGFRQIGAKRGKIGHPLPGMSVRIVDPQTFAPLPVGQPGLHAGARPQRHAGLPWPPGQDRRGAARRLVCDRRHRGH